MKVMCNISRVWCTYKKYNGEDVVSATNSYGIGTCDGDTSVIVKTKKMWG